MLAPINLKGSLGIPASSREKSENQAYGERQVVKLDGFGQKTASVTEPLAWGFGESATG